MPEHHNNNNGRRPELTGHDRPAWADAPRPYGMPEPVAAGQGISVMEVLQVLRRWWWQCGLSGLSLSAAAGAIVWFTFVPVYESAAFLEIKNQTPFIAFPDHSNAQAFAQTELETIRSPIVLSRVAAKPEIASLREAQEAKATDRWLAKGLRARYVGSSELCEVAFRANDPSAAALVANAIIDEYLALHQDTSSEQTERMISLLNEQQRERKAEVEALRDSVRTLTKKTTGFDPIVVSGKDNSAIVMQDNPISKLQAQRATEQANEVIINAELKAVQESLAKKQVEVPQHEIRKAMEDHPEVRRLRGMIVQHQTLLGGYAQRSAKGWDDPTVVQKKKEIDAIEGDLEKLLVELEPAIRRQLDSLVRGRHEARVSEIELELDHARNKLAEWDRQVEEQRKELEKHGDELLNLEFARGDLARSEEVHSLIAQRIIALKTEKFAPRRAAKRQPATAPVLPLEAVPYKRLGMACFGAFLFPFGLAFVWERWVRRISDGRRVASEANLPVLGEIAALPSRVSSPDKRSNGFVRDRVTFEESVDALRVGVMFSPNFRDIQTLAVTSAVSREGKTSLASSLTISLANATREPVLLIDADMRAPDLHDMFGTSCVPGLAEVLGQQTLSDGAVTRQVAPNVDLLPAGKLVASPHSLLRRGVFESLLAEFKHRYRYIVVDTPPVLSASEALVLANACDGVLVCTRCDYSRGPQLKTATERLATAGARLMGVVISAVPTRVWAYRYGGYGYGWERYAPSYHRSKHHADSNEPDGESSDEPIDVE